MWAILIQTAGNNLNKLIRVQGLFFSYYLILIYFCGLLRAQYPNIVVDLAVLSLASQSHHEALYSVDYNFIILPSKTIKIRSLELHDSVP